MVAGLRYCIDCTAYAKAWGDPIPKRSAPNPGPRCATHHREVVKERKKAAHLKHVAKTYGDVDYWALYEYQGGVCAICRIATGKTKNLAVDHDHQSGDVRGLLCSPCNRMLGHARDAVAFFVRGIDYLRYPPAKMMKGEVNPPD